MKWDVGMKLTHRTLCMLVITMRCRVFVTIQIEQAVS